MKHKRRRAWQLSITYGFVRARQLDGTLFEGPKVGGYLVTHGRVLASWGRVSETRWPRPRKGSWWPPNEPPGLDEIAKHNRVTGHFRARDLSEIRRCIAQGVPVQLALPIYERWRSPVAGVIQIPRLGQPFTENHAIVAEAFDDERKLIKFWNNWGSGWGDNSYGYLPYEYIDNYLKDAWVTDWRRPGLHRREINNAFRYINRQIGKRNCLGYIWDRIDLWDVLYNIRIGWCFSTIRDNWFEIEDIFLRPEYRTSGHLRRLVQLVQDSAHGRFGCPIRFWIPDADIHAKSANFSTVNDVIRALNLKVRKAG
jgi:hypothetical protein